MIDRPIPSLTLKKQRIAADPSRSIWVSAHAGSGKTYVLAQRVLRLLLNGVPPSHILCLTYTKAAAANMSARVYDNLAKWVLLDDVELVEFIEATGASRPSKKDLVFARQLFARAVETPGGLKIQTIHAFCERILHLFPFEANVPAGFSVVDDVLRSDLLERAKKLIIQQAISKSSALNPAFEQISREIGAGNFETICSELLFNRELILDTDDFENYYNELQKYFGLTREDNLEKIDQEMIFGGEEPAQWSLLADQLEAGGLNDKKLGLALREAFAHREAPLCLDLYLSVFFTKEGAPRGIGSRAAIISKKLSELHPGLLARLESERDRLDRLINKRKAAALIERSRSLIALGRSMLDHYQQLKRSQNLLDYDDLIERTRRLLSCSSPSWVIYKLDSQIDHILLDEAQDTSAAQWDILTAIADEFCSGVSARSVERSFFAVGDEKQSIFSFQGAAPDKFQEMRRLLEQRFKNADLNFDQIALHQSFRSAPGILSAVDTVFSNRDNEQGLGLTADETLTHEAVKADVPALVEIWPLIGKAGTQEPQDWRLPVDAPERDDPAERLAEKIAAKIKKILDVNSGETVEENGQRRAVNASDILILVRQRSAFFEAMIRALKIQHIPVAGADRLDLIHHIAVIDLITLGRVALLVDDDLMLAGLLKSPFIGFDDADLILLAPDRTGSLFNALSASQATHHKKAVERIELWRKAAQQSGPFEFYSHILASQGYRASLIARLGIEANDVIDEFLSLALTFERSQSASLAKFLSMVQSLDLSIKRDLESVQNAVRVMTVHAAKGLEAKIVFLPDTCGAPSGKHDPSLFTLNSKNRSLLIWSRGKDSDPKQVTIAREVYRKAERAEHQRLLYVALTRAEERLYISGFHGRNGPAEGCWYLSLLSALSPLCIERSDPLQADQQILSFGELPRHKTIEQKIITREREVIPKFALTPPPPESEKNKTLFPSRPENLELLCVSGLDERRKRALLVGALSHELLQYLPDVQHERRQTHGEKILQRRASDLDIETQTEILSSVLELLDDPQAHNLFGENSLAEVDVAATLAAGKVVRGRIDRLAQVENEIWIADFKTDRTIDSFSEIHLRQIALYRAAIQSLYPGKIIRCFLIWLRQGKIDEIASSLLDEEIKKIL
ncbi:MAG: double-strand break repair helicase AddA [Methylocystaceae bacterium]|nr:double-strand break repair helicase AddA [Methylocystaceae bacterium]